jgi:hypothetical protein
MQDLGRDAPELVGFHPVREVAVSTVTGQGLDRLREELRRLVFSGA